MLKFVLNCYNLYLVIHLLCRFSTQTKSVGDLIYSYDVVWELHETKLLVHLLPSVQCSGHTVFTPLEIFLRLIEHDMAANWDKTLRFQFDPGYHFVLWK